MMAVGDITLTVEKRRDKRFKSNPVAHIESIPNFSLRRGILFRPYSSFLQLFMTG